MRRITKAALGGVAGCALVLGATQVASGSAVEEYNYEKVDLVDIRPLPVTPEDPDAETFDNAIATLRIKEYPESGTASFKLRVEDIATSAAGRTFGAHLHTDPCHIVGTGGRAGPHYNHDVVTGDVVPARISSETEVWFDLVPSDNGVATANITVPFAPDDSELILPLTNQISGDMAVIIHALPTNSGSGAAGFRQACMPLPAPQWLD